MLIRFIGLTITYLNLIDCVCIFCTPILSPVDLRLSSELKISYIGQLINLKIASSFIRPNQSSFIISVEMVLMNETISRD